MAKHQPLIAIVDDDESVRTALARMLRASSFDVSIHSSGRAFLDSLQRTIPDCVVMDFHMPGISGDELQRELAKTSLCLPVIVVTAHDYPIVRRRALDAGALAYLTKPLRRDTLLRFVAEATHIKSS